ncbi:SMI1/KNR4 family protein [Tundrisphaera sp. TA3]|uniref:SMI1/KNR4 family protein n=1 Tax=Tundrisphaera sp. TA3 TaxID=3435775 RepID=UPI003EC0D30E
MPTLVDRLLAFWASVGVSPRPGASPEALAAFEDRHGVALSPDLRAYFSAADGMDPDVRDDLFFRFVPLAEFAPSAERGGPPGSFVLAEHRLGGFSYVVRLDPEPGEVSLWDGDWVRPVAPSFPDFLGLYLSSPGKLFPSDESAGD